MIYDFLETCKTYDKDIYNREYFNATHCPKCPAVGRFNMHGTYWRYAIYFEGDDIICRLMEIKRIRCLSCKTTHAVMPGDIIPYMSLSLFVLVFILVSFHLGKIPCLKIADGLGFSYQFIYSVIGAFKMHMNNIRQYIREISTENIPAVFDACGILGLIKKPYTDFQIGYIVINRRPCFMCRFFGRQGAPPVGLHAPRGAAT